MEHLYVLSNRAQPGLFKIGWTANAVADRVKQLNSTGVAHSFEIEADFEFRSGAKMAEGEAHRHFAEFRVNAGREFFNAPKDVIIAWLNKEYGQEARDILKEYEIRRLAQEREREDAESAANRKLYDEQVARRGQVTKGIEEYWVKKNAQIKRDAPAERQALLAEQRADFREQVWNWAFVVAGLAGWAWFFIA